MQQRVIVHSLAMLNVTLSVQARQCVLFLQYILTHKPNILVYLHGSC